MRWTIFCEYIFRVPFWSIIQMSADDTKPEEVIYMSHMEWHFVMPNDKQASDAYRYVDEIVVL